MTTPATPGSRDTLVAILADAIARHGDRPLFGLRQPDGAWRWQTYREFGAQVDAFRAALAELGVDRGDKVAVISANRLEWAIGCYATYGRAAAYVPMYEAQLDRDWEHILRDSGSKVCLVASDEIAARVRRFAPKVELVVFGDDFQARSARGAARAAGETLVAPTPADVATLIYTSGTTGVPKGVMLTHANQAANVAAVGQVMSLGTSDRSLAFLPWAHVAGGSAELHGGIYNGCSIGICEKPELLVESLPRVQPTFLIAVPRIWNKIYDGLQKQVAGKPKPVQKLFAAGLRASGKRADGKPLGLGERLALAGAERLIFSKVRAKLGGKLRFAYSGAAALSPDVARFIDAVGVPVFEVYGMTETSAVSTANAPGAKRIGSVGKAVPGVRITLDHEVSGGDKEQGEVIVYGHGVMAGYHNQPEATRECLTADGGMRTGDLGRFDADGFLYITGRVKEIYKLENGKYVAPAPLEEKITLSPYIAQAFVHGQNRPFNVALLVMDVAAVSAWAAAEGLADAGDPARLAADPRVKQLLRGELDKAAADWKGFERVADFVITHEEMTAANDLLTPTLKIKRRKVMERHGAALEALYGGAAAKAAAARAG